jgi:hypothetical protein
MNAEAGAKVTFDECSSPPTGRPSGPALRWCRAPRSRRKWSARARAKIYVFKFKRRKNYRRKMTSAALHRVRITDLKLGLRNAWHTRRV